MRDLDVEVIFRNHDGQAASGDDFFAAVASGETIR
jgi:hypothetical protein